MASFWHGKTSSVLVEITGRHNDLALRAQGPEAKELLSAVTDELDALNDSYGDLTSAGRVHRRIPCTCDTCRTLVDPHFYDHRNLVQRRSDGQRTVECALSYRQIDVLSLLDGVNLGSMPGHRRREFDDLDGPAADRVASTVINAGTVNIGTTAAAPARMSPPPPAAAPTPANTPDRWTLLSVGFGLACAAVAAAVLTVDSASVRLFVTVVAAAGLGGFLFMHRRDPKNFYRRLLGWWVPGGVGVSLIGYSVDLTYEAEGVRTRFTFGERVSWWWWLVWLAGVALLIGADLRARHQRDIPYRPSK